MNWYNLAGMEVTSKTKTDLTTGNFARPELCIRVLSSFFFPGVPTLRKDSDELSTFQHPLDHRQSLYRQFACLTVPTMCPPDWENGGRLEKQTPRIKWRVDGLYGYC